MKRIVSIFLVLSLILSSLSVFAASGMTRGEVADMLLTAADDYNRQVKKTDILKGYPDGSLHEERGVTRAEALVMLRRAFGPLPDLEGHNAAVAICADDFTDVPAWAKTELSDVFRAGIAAGTSKGVFSPDADVTESQMELFCERVYSVFGTNERDDFYAAVNRNTLNSARLGAGRVITGTLYELGDEANSNVSAIIDDIISKKNPSDKAEKKILDFYKSVVDKSGRRETKLAPIQRYLDAIDGAEDISELLSVQNDTARDICCAPLLAFLLSVDIKDSTKYILTFDFASPTLSKQFYENPSDTQKNAYINYLTGIFELSGEDSFTAKIHAEGVFRLEQSLSGQMLDEEEYANSDKTYNIYKFSSLEKIFPNADLKDLASACSLKPEDEVLVQDTGLMRAVSELLRDELRIETLRSYTKLNLLLSVGALLDDDFYKLSEKFNSEFLGVEGAISEKDRAALVVQNVMPDYLGKIYSEKYFDEQSKKDVENMISDIIAVYKKRIDSLDWMSDTTKARAKKKLETMKLKIGYPDGFGTYLDKVNIKSPEDGGSYFKNMIAISLEYKKTVASLQGSTVDNDAWAMYPYTANACYSATSNDITFPAAILQPPVYDKNAPYEQNLGGIGYIIAHEITHAFDNNGAKFDENGNAADWWTPEDYSSFKLLCDKVVTLFNGEEGVPGVPMNGKLTLSENVADLGAAACITEVAKGLDNPDFKLLYRSMAKSWANTQTREFAEYNATVDVHSDGKVRVNRVLQNIDEFYTAFGIKEGDGMYLAPEKRVRIW